ncbi:diacylglycerol/lipid kinase family protein [Lactococcus termiticola]|uniref:Diacylglycerol kinase family protein n=1 Tax=Lactococcus termiticola TaxID=2169526 RepID=A0A2R5HIS6_9LACT|nr:YegS/Rv2252/BmrU family lipid kinase [Lactococcus termiticola]GBG97545.1 diacylglycerol kinase family protein [Lactococcus termiticola]
MTYYILANPNSGGSKGQKTLDILEPYFKENEIDYALFATTQMGQEKAYIDKILSQMNAADHLIIIGGDGTLSLAVDVLSPAVPFSYIPAGSGNDFARSLGIPFDPIQAFEAIPKMEKHDIYIMTYQSEKLSGHALNNIGIGLDAAIVKATNKSWLKKVLNFVKMGQISYFMTALRILFTKKPFVAEVSRDGEKLWFKKAFLMTFTKHPYFGGGIKIAPEASNMKEPIELVEVDRYPLLTIFSLIPQLLKAEHLKDDHFSHEISNTFKIKLAETQAMQIDGEESELMAGDELLIQTEKRTIIF